MTFKTVMVNLIEVMLTSQTSFLSSNRLRQTDNSPDV